MFEYIIEYSEKCAIREISGYVYVSLRNNVTNCVPKIVLPTISIISDIAIFDSLYRYLLGLRRPSEFRPARVL